MHSLIFAYGCWIPSYHVSGLYYSSIRIGCPYNGAQLNICWLQGCAKYALIQLLQFCHGIPSIKTISKSVRGKWQNCNARIYLMKALFFWKILQDEMLMRTKLTTPLHVLGESFIYSWVTFSGNLLQMTSNCQGD